MIVARKNKCVAKTVAAALSAVTLMSPAIAESDVQSWNAIILNGAINEGSPWQLWFDGHLRFKDDAHELGTSIFRPGLGYRVNQDLTLWLGYARITSDVGDNNVDEDRIWQQATFPITHIMGQPLTGRTRLEQRLRPNGPGDTGHRLRQFVRWATPLNDTWSWVVWDELFIGLNDSDWGQRSGFDQNRFYTGPAWQIDPQWRLEMGYMHNFINPPGGTDNDRTNHNLSITLFGSW